MNIDNLLFSLFRKVKFLLSNKREGYASDLDIIRDIQSGCVKNALCYRELKFLLDDCKRAQSAYPELSFEEITEGRWFLIGEEAFSLLPEGMQKNLGSPREVRALMPVVRAMFLKRTSLEDAALNLGTKKRREDEERVRNIKENGPYVSSGEFQVSYDKSKKEIIVKRTPNRTSIGTVWKFPFIWEEWTNFDSWITIEKIKSLPSFRQVEESFFRMKPRISGMFFPVTDSQENWREEWVAYQEREREAIERQELPLREKLGLNGELGKEAR